MLTKTEVVVWWKFGLHMRPATQIVQMVRQYQADVTFISGTIRADGKSLMQLLTLDASYGTRLILQVEGKNARALIKAIALIFREGSPF